MIDLSNNTPGQVDFRRLYAAGQRRVYLKLTEGDTFHDGRHDDLRRQAIAAGFLVGEYHYARPASSRAAAEADWFLEHLPKLRRISSLRPVLDFEDPGALPGPHLARWALEWLDIVGAGAGVRPVIYGNGPYLSGCRFAAPPAKLWLAQYGRNDGREHPFTVPRPWTNRSLAAVQYTSRARMAGVQGLVDESHVYSKRELSLPRTGPLARILERTEGPS